MHLTRSSRDPAHGEIDVVSGTGCHATGGGELIGNRTHRRPLDWHRRLQRIGRIMPRGFVHHLGPDRQCQGGTVTVRDNCRGLIEPNPHTARERARVPDKPGVLVIVGGASFSCRR